MKYKTFGVERNARKYLNVLDTVLKKHIFVRYLYLEIQQK